MQFSFSLAQMHVRLGKPDENLQSAVQFVQAAATYGSSFLLLPELWSCGYDLANAARYAARSPEILAELQRLARQHQLCIGGSLLEARQDGIYNTFSWIDPAVPKPASYRKIHLFRLMREEQFLRAGDQPVTVPTAWGPAGLAVCYDLRFPELFRGYALAGARSLLLAAEWPWRRIQHWQVLLRARAIENQAFVFGVNCVGAAAKDRFGGRTAAVSPWGDVLAEGSQAEEELVQGNFETQQVDQARAFLPIFQDRRPDVYTGA